MATKEVLHKLLDRLSDDATIEHVQYQIYVLQKIHAGQEDIRQGRTIPHDQVMKEFAQWLK
jgi:predicted transcriptional regulator